MTHGPERLGNSESQSQPLILNEKGGIRWRDALIALGVLASGTFAGGIDASAVGMMLEGEPINIWSQQPVDSNISLSIILGSIGGSTLSGLTILANQRLTKNKAS